MPPQHPSGWRGPGRPPPEPPTQRLPRPGRAEPPTEQLRAPRRPVDPATERMRATDRADAAATEKIETRSSPKPKPKRAGLRGWQSILLIVIIVVALVIGGLAGAELYARHRAGTILSEVTQCVVQDGAAISFGVNPPFLWQHITGHYTNLTVETDGNQVQAAKGMTADVSLRDIRLQGTDDSKGTIGSLTATLSWTAAGIKDTVADNLPGVGALISDVKTDPAAGTLILEAAAGTSVTAEPVVTDGDLNLHVLDVTGPFSQDAVQTALDDLTKKLNDNYPLGIHADSVAVTDTGVVGKFSSQNASIPTGDSNECFASL